MRKALCLPFSYPHLSILFLLTPCGYNIGHPLRYSEGIVSTGVISLQKRVFSCNSGADLVQNGRNICNPIEVLVLK